MQNEVFQKPAKRINLKALTGIILGIILIIVGIIVILANVFRDDSEFIENSNKRLPEVSESKYINLDNFDVFFDGLSSFYEDEIQEKITFFFTYAYPEISTLTVKNVKTYDEAKQTDYPDELDSMNPYETTEIELVSDTRKKFFVKVQLESGTYNLIILDLNNSEKFFYTGGDITKDLYASAEYDSLLDVILDKLPVSLETESKVKFEITYEGDPDDRLTISPTESSLSTEDCKEALETAAEWANSLNLKYSKEITENNFTCEL